MYLGHTEENMALSFSEEQAMILDGAREFCSAKSDIESVRKLLTSDQGFNADVWKEIVELGWLGVAIPENFGGSGLGVGSVVPIAECMGKNLLATPFFSTTLAAQAILRAGTPGQQDLWLPKIAEGAIATLALIESEDWGNDTLTCTASEMADGLVLEGAKMFVTDAAVTDLFVVAVNYQGNSALVLVNKDQVDSKAIQHQTLIDETKRSSIIDFTGITVSKDAMLDISKTDSTLRDIKLIGALLVAAEATGSTAAALDLTVEYLKTRKQFGKLIGSYQSLKHPTVDMLNQMEAARGLVYHAATIVGDDSLDKDMEVACRMAKVQATEALLFAGDRAVQFHGGMGFTYECDAQLYIRRAQWSQQQFGDAYHHRKRLVPLLLD